MLAKDFIFYEFFRMNMLLMHISYKQDYIFESLEFTWLAHKPALLGERIVSTVRRDTEMIRDATFRVAHNNRGRVSDPVSHFERLTT